MKRFWTRSTLATLIAAVSSLALAQEPDVVDVLKPVDVLLSTTAPMADPAAELASLTSDVYALASGDLVTLRTFLEPTSPSGSQNDPTQTTATWVVQAAPPRDAFEERVARLEAQVAALAAQLRSNTVAPSGPAATAPATTVRGTLVAPRVAVGRPVPAIALYRNQVAPAVAAPMATTHAARYYSLAQPAQAAATATTSAAPDAPIVIHIYVHGAPAAAAVPAAPSAYFYSDPPTTAPAGAAAAIAPSAPMMTTPVRVRARTMPATPSVPGVQGVPAVVAPTTSANPTTLPLPTAPQPTTGVLFVPAAPATPAVPAIRALPATPGVPVLPAAPAAAPAAPSATPAGTQLPTNTSRIAWDDVPVNEP